MGLASHSLYVATHLYVAIPFRRSPNSIPDTGWLEALVLFEDVHATLRVDWQRTGWNRWLPSEAGVLWDLLCDATVSNMEGDLDELVDWQSMITYPIYGLDKLDALDGPLRSRRGDRRQLARLLARAGCGYPRTVRQLAGLGMRLGLYRRIVHEGRVRWRIPWGIPLPDEVLPMTRRQSRVEDAMRWRLSGAESGMHIVEMLLREGEPKRRFTSIAKLAARSRLCAETVRHGLTYLCEPSGQGRFARALLRVHVDAASGWWHPVNPERLADDVPCLLEPNWRELWRRHGTLCQLRGKGALDQ